MSTYRELIYIVSDLAKELNDDSTLNENHIMFLLNKYRTYLLKQKYTKKAQEIPLSNYQTVCSKLIEVPFVAGCPSEDCMKYEGKYLRSEHKIDFPLTFSDTQATVVNCEYKWTFIYNDYSNDEAWAWFRDTLGIPSDLTLSSGTILKDYYLTSCNEDASNILSIYQSKGGDVDDITIWGSKEECLDLQTAIANNYSNVTVVSRERFPYAGEGKFSTRFVYGTIGPDQYFYVKGKSKHFKDYNKVFITGIFENPVEAYENSVCTPCTKSANDCDEWDYTFPLEDALQTQLISLVCKEVLGSHLRVADTKNDGRDNLVEMENFVRNYLKERGIRGMNGED